MTKPKDNLENELQRIRNRYTRGASKPVAFLLHPADFVTIWNRYAVDGCEELLFCGIECIPDKRPFKGEPMAIVTSC
jgi:hypothetical protein